MTKKRPHAGEGRLGLPRRFPAAAPESARRLVQVTDDALAPLGIRAGDAVVLIAGRRPEHGDVVALAEAGGPLRLWRAWPEAERLRLTRGDTHRDLSPDASVEGVVVAVLRKFASAASAPRRP